MSRFQGDVRGRHSWSVVVAGLGAAALLGIGGCVGSPPPPPGTGGSNGKVDGGGGDASATSAGGDSGTLPDGGGSENSDARTDMVSGDVPKIPSDGGTGFAGSDGGGQDVPADGNAGSGTGGLGVGGMGVGGSGVAGVTDGGGGVGGTGGGDGGGGVPGTTECTTVSTQDFETIPAAATWLTDNSRRQAGLSAAHPPMLAEQGKASTAFSCDGRTHTQIKFWYLGVAPTAGQSLNLYVDNVLYQRYGSTFDAVTYSFRQVVITLPRGTHSYQWEATTTSAAQPPFWIDTISCTDSTGAPSTTERFDFEECFRPQELAGDFQVDNSAAQTGALSAHPAILADRSKATMTFNCGGQSHSQLTFWYLGFPPAAGQKLNFYVDNALYQTYGATFDSVSYSFRPVILTVPTGTHTYRWEATTDLAGQPPFWIDSIRCTNTPIVPIAGTVGFEDGFVPQETTGEFQIDNSSAQAGVSSAHPPILADSAKATMSFACGGQSHSQLTFWYRGLPPAAGQKLNFYVDNALYQTYGATFDSVTYSFRQVILTVPSGTHNYRWEATTDLTGQPPFWIDSVRCTNTPTVPIAGTFGFEEGFVPQEVTGEFQVDNSAAQAGSSSAHPPILADSAKATMGFACGGESHSQLTFWYRGFPPAAGQKLNFYVDNALYQTYGATFDGVTYSFRQVILTVPTGTHSYRWEATTDLAGQPPFWIDSIRCTNTSIVPIAGTVGFEEGFVPQEITGNFQIDNSSAQGGAMSTHPPILADSAKATMSFACGGQSHSQITFWYRGFPPAAGQQLNFYVDNVLFQTYGATFDGVTYSFRQVVVPVTNTVHAYSWEATTTLPGQPPFWVDTIRCQ